MLAGEGRRRSEREREAAAAGRWAFGRGELQGGGCRGEAVALATRRVSLPCQRRVRDLAGMQHCACAQGFWAFKGAPAASPSSLLPLRHHPSPLC